MAKQQTFFSQLEYILCALELLMITSAFGCTSDLVQFKRKGEDVTLQFQKATTVNSENPDVVVTNIIVSPNGSKLLTVIYLNGNLRYTSICTGCMITGNVAAGDLTVRIDNIQMSAAGTYKHAVYTNDNVLTCVTLYVLGIPNKPTISANKNPANVEESVKLTCTSTSTTTPRNHGLSLTYSWTVDNTVNPSGSRYTYSGNKRTLTVSDIVKEDSSKHFTCTATENVNQGYTSTSSDSLSLNVLYGPDNLTFNPADTTYTREENTTLSSVTCYAECNPTCTFKWTKIGQGADISNSAVLSLGKLASTEAGTYRCTATRGGTLTRTKDLTVNVIYGPRRMYFTPTDTSYRQDEHFLLPPITCRSECWDCEYSWKGPNVSHTGPVLSLGKLTKAMAGVYTCTARNIQSSQQPQQSKEVKLEVRYGPDKVSLSPQTTSYTVDEGFILNDIQCSADCFPACTYRWTKGQSTEVSQTDTLSLGIMEKSDTGRYTCTATNSDTPSKLLHRNITVTVRYTRVQSFYVSGHTEEKNVTVDEHDPFIQFNCIVQSYTATSIEINFEGSAVSKQINGTFLSYSLHDVACTDAGVYTCETNNAYNRTSSKEFSLFVKCSPRPLRQIQRNITTELYNAVNLNFSAIAYPLPGPTGFSWHKKQGERWLPLLSNADLKISSSDLKSSLTVLNVSKEDFGQYRVTVINDIARYEQYLFLSEKKDQQITYREKGTRKSDYLALPIGLTLGVVCCALAVYATCITFHFKRLKRQSGETSRKPASQIPYSNPTFASDVNRGQRCLSSFAGGSESAASQYTDLSRYANTDKDAYDVISRP